MWQYPGERKEGEAGRKERREGERGEGKRKESPTWVRIPALPPFRCRILGRNFPCLCLSFQLAERNGDSPFHMDGASIVSLLLLSSSSSDEPATGWSRIGGSCTPLFSKAIHQISNQTGSDVNDGYPCISLFIEIRLQELVPDTGFESCDRHT